jgi:hypothetical protein
VRKEQVVPTLRHEPWRIRHRPRPVRDLINDAGGEVGHEPESFQKRAATIYNPRL